MLTAVEALRRRASMYVGDLPLTLRIFAQAQEWTQEYVRGSPQSSLDSVGPASDSGTELSFLLDGSILPFVEFDLSEFAAWLRATVVGIDVRVSDSRSGESVMLVT